MEGQERFVESERFKKRREEKMEGKGEGTTKRRKKKD